MKGGHPTAAVAVERLRPGFGDPVLDSQRCFRAVLDAMAHPGRIADCMVAIDPPPPLVPAQAAVALTLLDLDTPVWLDDAARQPAVVDFLRFHAGCPLAETPAAAAFAVIGDPRSLLPLDRFGFGSDEYPDRAATLLVAVSDLDGAAGLALSGPGIDGAVHLAVTGLPGEIWAARQALRPLLPRGLDLILCAGRQLAALPRTTLVKE